MTRRSLRSWITAGISGLLIGGGLLTTGAWFWARGSVQRPGGSLRLDGLSADATVFFDDFTIPHIFAADELDAFFVQGYLHAGERLWQMELFRRTGQGRLAELFGEPAVPADRLLRTLDLWGAAGRSLEAAGPAELRRLEAYAAGVNAKLADWSGPLPPEFWLLGIRPESWEPRSTVLIARLMALDLSSWRTELARFHASLRLTPDKQRRLRPRYPAWGPTVLEAFETEPPVDLYAPSGLGTAAPAETTVSNRMPFAEPKLAAAGTPRGVDVETYGRALEFLDGVGFPASNNWVVDATRTAAGRPLLANDMHLALRAPSTWYINALHGVSDDYAVAGLSIPGTPGVIVGYNRNVAWGFTNGMVDDADFAIETVNLDQSAYMQDSVWTPFRTRSETIHVRGGAEVTHQVRETSRGPVISDVVPSLGVTLSMVWIGHRPTNEVAGMLAMNRATDAATFDRAVRQFTAPHQNVVYATTDGTIGYRLGGSVPIRERLDGSMPVSHEQLATGWSGTWPPQNMPAARDPSSGFFASANNLQARTFFAKLGIDYPTPFRARRISDLLSSRDDWTVDRMRGLQTDTHSLLAMRLRDRAASAAERAGSSEAAATLRAWDGFASLDSEGATLFHIWLYRLRDRIAADEFEGADWTYFPINALLAVIESADSAWVDDARTTPVETLEELEVASMREAIDLSARRPWGEIHRERSVHPLGRAVWLDRLFGFNVGPYPAPGGPGTVRPDDPGRWSPLDATTWMPPFINEYGPSERFVADLNPEGPIGFFLLPTGESGNPFSPHYRDMTDQWLEADLIPVPLDRGAALQRAARTMRLSPRARASPPREGNSRALTGSKTGNSLRAPGTGNRGR